MARRTARSHKGWRKTKTGKWTRSRKGMIMKSRGLGYRDAARSTTRKGWRKTKTGKWTRSRKGMILKNRGWGYRDEAAPVAAASGDRRRRRSKSGRRRRVVHVRSYSRRYPSRGRRR